MNVRSTARYLSQPARGTCCALAAALAVLAAFSPDGSAAQDEAPPGLPELAITLAPGGVDADGNPAWIDVTMTFPGGELAAGDSFLRAPVEFAGVSAVEYSNGDLTIVDESGAIPLYQALDDPDAGGFLYWRRWTATRAIDGNVELRYRAPVTLVKPRLGSGPPFDVRPQGGGLSGSLNTFLIMPDTERPFMIDIGWDLDALAPGSVGVTSFGEGDTRSPGPVDRLIATFIMAGPLGEFPRGKQESRFSGYWIGKPAFDAYEMLQWSQRAYEMVADFFGDTDPPAFRVFLRGNPYPGGGGSALMNSFLLSFPDTEADVTELRETIAHETVHNWISSIGGPPGTTLWFSEGMTVHYTRELLFRSGLFTAKEYLDSVNDTAANYYTNPLHDLPNEDIAAGFWKDARIRRLPYVRGSFYFADVDARIRERSDGERSLDDLVTEIIAIRRSGQEVTADTWRRIVAEELGPAGAEDLDAMLNGRLIVPPSVAFGACFERRAVPLRPFELGFDLESLTDQPRILSGLVVGSAAARAGLKNGDAILAPVPLYDVQNEPDMTLTLELRRGNEEFGIEYLPRGEPVDGYQWFRRPGVSDTGCRNHRSCCPATNLRISSANRSNAASSA
jgi:hypothetical protein